MPEEHGSVDRNHKSPHDSDGLSLRSAKPKYEGSTPSTVSIYKKVLSLQKLKQERDVINQQKTACSECIK